MIKPGYKTIAFYGGLLATVLAFLFGGEVLDPGDGLAYKIGTTLASVLAAAGFTAWRRYTKPSDSTKHPLKTTEFYLTAAAALLGALYMSGIWTAGGQADQIMGFVATILAALGYAVPKDAGTGPTGGGAP